MRKKSITKTNFIAQAKKQIEVNLALMKAVYIIESEAKAFDGKVVNKRFVDAMNKALKESDCEANSVYFSFEKEYGRFILTCGDRTWYSYDYSGYRNSNDVDYYQRWLTPLQDAPFIKYDGRLNYDALYERILYTADQLNYDSKDLKKSIDSADEYAQKLAKVAKEFKSLIDEMPHALKNLCINDISPLFND